MSKTKVYVQGNVYYELEGDGWTEIKVLFDDSVVFTVPAGEVEDYEEILEKLVILAAKTRIQKLIPGLALDDTRFSTDFSVHELRW